MSRTEFFTILLAFGLAAVATVNFTTSHPVWGSIFLVLAFLTGATATSTPNRNV